MRLKDRTLKNNYERRALRENAAVIEEAGLDPVKMKEYEAALDKLKGLVPPQAAIFNKAIEDAKTELENYIQGGVGQALKNIFTKDPVAKAVNFANQIRAGMANVPALAKSFVPPGSENETQKSFLELVPQEKQQKLIGIMVKAFGNKLPYVSNMTAAVQEMLQNTNPQGLYKNAQAAAAMQQIAPPPAQPAQADPAAATPAAGQAAAPATAGQAAPTPTAGTTAVAPTQGAKAAIPPTASKVAAPAAAAANKKLDPAADAQKINDIAYFLASQSGVDKEAAAKIIQALAKAKGLNDIPVPAQPSNKLAAGAVPAATPAKV